MLEVAKIKEDLYKEGSPVIIRSGTIFNQDNQFLVNLIIKNISNKVINSIKLDLHIFNKANNEIEVVRDYIYLVKKMERDDEIGKDIFIALSKENPFTIGVAVTNVDFDDGDVFQSSNSIWFQSLPKAITLYEKFENNETVEQFKRDFVKDFAEKKNVIPNIVPFVYKDLWCCSCQAINHDGESCHNCGAQYLAQHEHVSNRIIIETNLTEYKNEIARQNQIKRDEAKRKVEQLRATKEKAEQDALEEKARLEQEQIAFKRKRKIILSITIPAFILVCLYLYLLAVYIIPTNKYNDALEMLSADEYEEAIAVFEELEDFSNSAEMVIESKYLKAEYLYENESYTEAVVVYETIADLKDVEQEINEAKYQEALVIFGNEDYQTALEMFEKISSYSNTQDYIEKCNYFLALENIEDLSVSTGYFNLLNEELSIKVQEEYFAKAESLIENESLEEAETYFAVITDSEIVEKINEIHYNQAMAYIDEKEYEKAQNLLNELASYSDSENQLLRINYLIGQDNVDLLDYEIAIEYFTLAENYEDSAEKINYCNYNIATNLFNDAEYQLASEMFAELGEYSDSQDCYYESTYQWGIIQLNNGDVMDSYTTLYSIKEYQTAFVKLYKESLYYIYVYNKGLGSNPLYE